MKQYSLKEWLLMAVKGAIVGTGAILPGISGGVLCVAFGIYDPMMALLAHPFTSFPKYYRMFIPFLIGWAAGFVLLAKVVEQLFVIAPQIAMMLFAGLVLGTIPQLLKEAQAEKGTLNFTPMMLAFAFAVLVFSLMKNSAAIEIETNAAVYAFCGAVWGLSLVWPGLSSSSLLIMLGLDQPMTAGIAALDFSVILPLLAGLLTVVLLLSRVITHLFEKQRSTMLMMICGVVSASVVFILPQEFTSLSIFAVSLFCFIIGFAIARFMDQKKELLTA